MKWSAALLLFFLLAAACGDGERDPLLDRVGPLCATDADCGAPLFCAAPTFTKSICLLPRENGQDCQPGLAPIAWGRSECGPDGCTVIEARFACGRRCYAEADCPAGTHCGIEYICLP